MYKKFLIFPVLVVLLFLMMSGKNARKILPQSLARDKNQERMLTIALEAGKDSKLRYAALESVISRYREEGELFRLNSLLGEIIESHPDDPYNAYYLLAMAENARQTGSIELSLLYLRRLILNYPDLEIRNNSLHLLALIEIAGNTPDPREEVEIREKMERLFNDRIDRGRNFYYLAESYKQIGDWDKMYAAYSAFLESPETDIPGVTDARNQVIEDLRFHNSSKSWTMDNLDDLVRTIKVALNRQDGAMLARYQSVNFFLKNWSQDTSDINTGAAPLSSLIQRGIRYKNVLEDFSNNREAYLWTTGWSFKIPIWYLYFKRIDYPASPDINGNWEWAGIYFGERL